MSQSTDKNVALERFEAHLPLLERVIAQVMGGTAASVRDLVNYGAAILLRCSLEFDPAQGMDFTPYAEMALTHELLRFLVHPVPVLRLPHELEPLQARLAGLTENLTALKPATMALTLYSPAMNPALAIAGPEFPGGPAPARGPAVNPMGVLWSLFKKRAPLILGLVILTEVGITAVTMRAPKTWVASTTLNTGIGSQDPINGKSDWFTQGTVVANITELLKSRTVMENTAKALDLTTTPEKLAEHLTVTRIGQAGLLKIEADGPSAKAASELANATVREFLRYYATTQSHEARSNKAFFESQVHDAKKRLAKAETKLRHFKGQRVPEMEASVPARVADLMGQRDMARRDLAAASSGLAVAQAELARVRRDPLLSQKLMNTEGVMTATEKLRDLQMNLNDAKDIYGAGSPVVENLKNQIARAKSKLRTTSAEAVEQNPALAEASAKLVQLRTEQAMASARLGQIEQQLAALSPQASVASTDQVTYEQLQREVKIAETQYMDLQNRYGQTNLAAQGAANLTMSVVDAALPPQEPMSNKLALKLALGLLLSLSLGMFISYLLSLREKTKAEVEATSGPNETAPVVWQNVA